MAVGNFAVPLVVVAVFARHIRRHVHPPQREADQAVGRSLAVLVVGNLLLTANMVSIPALLRTQVDVLGPVLVASTQILISVSRVSTLIVGNIHPVVVARFAEGRDRDLRVARRIALGAAGFGALTVVAMAVLAPPLLTLLYGSAYEFTPMLALVASLPVLFLNPAYILMAVAIGRHEYVRFAVAWGFGLVVLVAVAVVPLTWGIWEILTIVTLAAAAPCAVLATAVLGRGYEPESTRR
jgi:O-antigen/teichoic acid export membrane protein